MLINSILAVIACGVVIGLLLFLSRRNRGSSAAKQPDNGITHHCPVCGSGLKRGERVFSEAISAENEKIMFIHGCHECRRALSEIKRICPVCRKELKQDDYLVGRMWEEPGKKRLHVAGCNSCKGFPKRG